jgi:hypothetical protein
MAWHVDKRIRAYTESLCLINLLMTASMPWEPHGHAALRLVHDLQSPPFAVRLLVHRVVVGRHDLHISHIALDRWSMYSGYTMTTRRTTAVALPTSTPATAS